MIRSKTGHFASIRDPLRCFAGALLLILLLSNAGSARCDDKQVAAGHVRELRLGVAAHDVGGLWSGDSLEDGPDLYAEILFNRPLFHLLKGTAYPNAGVTINTRGDTSKLYGGCLVQWTPSPHLIFSTGLGLALHNGETESSTTDRKSLGSNLLFRIPLEIGVAFGRHQRIILGFDHISNAYLTSPNDGMDTLGLFYGYHF